MFSAYHDAHECDDREHHASRRCVIPGMASKFMRSVFGGGSFSMRQG